MDTPKVAGLKVEITELDADILDTRKKLAEAASRMSNSELAEYADCLMSSPESIVFTSAPTPCNIHHNSALLGQPSHNWTELSKYIDPTETAYLVIKLTELVTSRVSAEVELRGAETVFIKPAEIVREKYGPR